MTTTKERSPEGIPWPVVWCGVLVFAYGIARIFFATSMLLVTTVLGPATGPARLILLNTVDLTIGVAATSAAIFFLLGRAWAGELMRGGWAALVLYEIGRAVGFAAADGNRFSDGVEALTGVTTLVLLISAGLCARSQLARLFTERG